MHLFFDFDLGDFWVLQEFGEHCHTTEDISIGTLGRSCGIHNKFKLEIDRLVKVGITPTKILIHLQRLILTPEFIEYKNVLPTIKQIVNRKKL